MPSIITSEYAEDLPVLTGLTPEQRRTVLDAANKVYNRLRNREEAGNVPTSEALIRQWGDNQTPPIPTADMTKALDYLTQSGQILWIADATAGIAAPPPAVPVQTLPQGPDLTPPDPPVTRAKPLEEMTNQELYDVAKAHDIPNRSKLSRRQLVNRIKKAEAGE